MSSEAGQIYVFDVESEKLLSTYTSHAMAVRSLAWSLDSQVSCFSIFLGQGANDLSITVVGFGVRRQTPDVTRCAVLAVWKARFRRCSHLVWSFIVGTQRGYLTRWQTSTLGVS